MMAEKTVQMLVGMTVGRKVGELVEYSVVMKVD